MKPLSNMGYCRLRNYETGKVDKIKIMVREVDFKPDAKHNRRAAAHRRFYSFSFAGSGRSALVPYRNILEGAFLQWIEECKTLQNVVPWPLTVSGSFNGVKKRYTPTYLVEIDPVPLALTQIGFGLRTFVDCKPELYRNNWDVQLSLEMLRLATRFPSVLVTDETVEVIAANGEQTSLPH